MCGTTQSKQSDPMAEKLQTVYEAIKRERPWDIRPVKNIYTTAKEKYMIQLIKDGHDISDDTIAHVVGRCYRFHHFDDTKYQCFFGFILTKEEYPDGHFECKSHHNLNKHLICSSGSIYFPVDILLNPFGELLPTKLKVNSEIQEVYDMIEQKWPNDWYEGEMHKYTLKHFINIIDQGNPVPKYLKQHVVDGCDKDHKLGDSYSCYSGFVVREKQKKSEYKKQSPTIVKFDFRDGALHYVMNSKFYDHTGIKDIQVEELKLRSYQTSQKITDQSISPNVKNVKKIFDRIRRRDLIKPQSAEKLRLTWQETYLVNQIKSGEDIPNDVITHVLDGCYDLGHLLTEKYACCRGYIIDKKSFLDHDIINCRDIHMLNRYLKCYEGRVYHRNAEIPKGTSKLKIDLIEISNFRHASICSKQSISMNTLAKISALPQLLNRAPPPPDYLDPDQLPVRRHRFGDAFRQALEMNEEAENVLEEQAEGRNVHYNPAPPPPEVEI